MKYNIPFGSPQHMQMDQLNIAQEYFENILIEEIKAELADESKIEKKPYTPGSGDIWKKADKKMTSRDQKALDNITSLDDFKIDENGKLIF